VTNDSSGNGGFDHFAATRFVRDGDRVKLLPDPLGGAFTTAMTPEQAEFLARHLLALSSAARQERWEKCPLLYPEDAPVDPLVVGGNP
jgi:hypothetical protein